VQQYDVAIIGGGPAGSTCAGFLRKYNPSLKVAVFERERFPRDHVGESQLPVISHVLHELGVWEKIERANFPIKVGATYRWGCTDELWDFLFVPNFVDEPRPAQYGGQRLSTAFQVDRAVYDKILLDHARELGADVFEETRVLEVLREGDRVEGLRVAPVSGDDREPEVVRARYYVDASGHPGILRRAMGVQTEEPTSLQNIAIWDYWQNAEWAVSVGTGGTRVLVMSLGYGWIWFIPLSPTRTSIGLILPAEYYKQSGKRPEELYREALSEDPLIASLIASAEREGNLATTKDWSFVAERMLGENWFLCGESAGFADPILAAGMSLAQLAARELAVTIIETDRGRHPKQWLLNEYAERQDRRIRQHIRFADYWYAGNGCFTDLKEFTREIAHDAGLEMDAEQAWQWLGTGGFIEEDAGGAGIAGFSFGTVRSLNRLLINSDQEWSVANANLFTLKLEDARRIVRAVYTEGRVEAVESYEKDGKRLTLTGAAGTLIPVLRREVQIDRIMAGVLQQFAGAGTRDQVEHYLQLCYECLEALVADGWVKARRSKNLPLIEMPVALNRVVGMNQDIKEPAHEAVS
jgi:flavin-dependent dehydrogenase